MINKLLLFYKRSVSYFCARKLFDGHLLLLKNRGCPERILELFFSQKNLVVEQMIKVWEKHNFESLEKLAARGIYLGIPIIPRTYIKPRQLMLMVRYMGNWGAVASDVGSEADEEIYAPIKPYYLYDVEDGQSFTATDIEKSIDIIRSRARLPLTTAEIVALCLHTDVLLRHGVLAACSRKWKWPDGYYECRVKETPDISMGGLYKGLKRDNDWIPSINIGNSGHGDTAILGWNWSRCTVASCGIRKDPKFISEPSIF